MNVAVSVAVIVAVSVAVNVAVSGACNLARRCEGAVMWRFVFLMTLLLAELLMSSTETYTSFTVLINTLCEETTTVAYYNIIAHSIRLNI